MLALTISVCAPAAALMILFGWHTAHSAGGALTFTRGEGAFLEGAAAVSGRPGLQSGTRREGKSVTSGAHAVTMRRGDALRSRRRAPLKDERSEAFM